MANPVPIPEPPGLPLLGNLLDVDLELPLKSLCSLAEKHGKITQAPILRLRNTY